MATVSDENRFSPITPDDHAGSLWIAALLCLVYSVTTMFLRGHLRWNMYGVDDYLALAATVSAVHLDHESWSLTPLQVLQVGEVVAVIVGLNHGLGRTQELLRASELKAASQVGQGNQLEMVVIDFVIRQHLQVSYSSSLLEWRPRPRLYV